MNTPIRFGFIGAGAIAHSSAHAVNQHAHGKVVAATDPHEGRLKEFCDSYHIPHAYPNADVLLADKDIDAVYIAVPNKFHVPLAVQALNAGKHVILEKPFALTYEEAKLAADLSVKQGKVLTVGMNQRFTDQAQKFHTLSTQGTFGEIYHAKAYWQRRAGIPKLGTWFGSKELAGGGCLYDIGVHLIDLCLYVIDNFEPVSVYGSTYSKFGHRGLGEGGWGKSENTGLPFEVEDFAAGQIRFANGATVSVDVTWARHAAEANRMDIEFYGTEAGASVLAGKVYRRDDTAKAHVTIDNPEAEIRFAHKDRFHNFINHILGKEELCVTLKQALVVQRILDGIKESSLTGDSVKIG